MTSVDHPYGRQSDGHIDIQQGKNEIDYYNQIYLLSLRCCRTFR